MKFNFQNLGYLAFVSILGLSSCSKDSETPAPTETFYLNGTTKTSAYFNDEEIAEFQLNLSGDGISSLIGEITYTDNGGASKTVTVKDANNGNAEINYTKSSDIEDYKGTNIVSILIPADAKRATEWTINMKAKNGGGTTTAKFTGWVVNTWSAKLLGGQTASAGSYFNSSVGEVLQGSVASTAPAGVDITYGYVGTPTALPSLISYKGRTAAGLAGAPAGAESSYFVETTLSEADFASDSKSWTAALANTAVGTTELVKIATGKVYAFKNAAGKSGLIHVSSIVDGFSGSVTIDVKAEK